jgi:hypothetical protein
MPPFLEPKKLYTSQHALIFNYLIIIVVGNWGVFETVTMPKLRRKASWRRHVDGISDRISQQHKDMAADHFHRGIQFLSEEYFPEERHDQFLPLQDGML